MPAVNPDDLPEIPLGKLYANPADDLPEIPIPPLLESPATVLWSHARALEDQVTSYQSKCVALETDLSFFKRESEILKEKVIQERLNTVRTAHMLVPILTQYLLMKGAQGASGLLPCSDENERTARELLRSFQQLIRELNNAKKKPT